MSDVRGPLVVLVGPPGSGKSTWARRHFHRREIVSSDRLRKSICGDPGNQDATRYAMEARDAIVRGRMRFGLTTVVDSTSAETEHREKLAGMRFISSINHPGVIGPTVAVIFDTSLDVCLARNAARRAGRVPEDVVRRYHAAIERDLPVASTWIPWPFDTGLRVRPGGTYRMGGRVRALHDLPWYTEALSLRACPDWVGTPGVALVAGLPDQPTREAESQ